MHTNLIFCLNSLHTLVLLLYSFDKVVKVVLSQNYYRNTKTSLKASKPACHAHF